MKNKNLDLAGVNYKLDNIKIASSISNDYLEQLKELSEKVTNAKPDSVEMRKARNFLEMETVRLLGMLIFLNDTVRENAGVAEELIEGKEV
ncbi:hypothetical protein [Jeotgalibaca porci]|uniref:hypothetical protein n=1 Tax=Jeotgalibaca porci TaxID=1868793 RepID=UPI0035A0810E